MWEGCRNVCVSWIIRRSHNLLRSGTNFWFYYRMENTHCNYLGHREHINGPINRVTSTDVVSVVKNKKMCILIIAAR